MVINLYFKIYTNLSKPYNFKVNMIINLLLLVNMLNNSFNNNEWELFCSNHIKLFFMLFQ